MAAEMTKTPGTTSASDHYQVFLSFRGPDTRQGFISCLYNIMVGAGIRVFKDDDELSIGQPIDTILLAIESSELCMPVFSPTFAESAWCLREVAKMVELKKEVVPVFFGVTPDDVKIRTNVYGQYMRNHEIKYGKDQVKQWEDALKTVAKIKGRELKDKSYWEFSRELVREVVLELNPNTKYVPDHLVGMEDQVDCVLKSLDMESDSIRCLGIHGIAGVGKTTLATVVFNKLCSSFDNSGFLANVRESLKLGGMESLQKELLVKLDPKLTGIVGSDNSFELIRKNFRHRKVLIVLDDVDKKEQIKKLVGEANCFGPGSIIIATTRDERALRDGFDPIFRVEGLNLEEGLRLFCRHAFKTDSPPGDYESLSSEIVQSCGGLPLAVKVVGSFLQGKEMIIWQDTKKTLQESPPREVGQKLMISYEGLTHEQQQMFLDIACFFIHTGKRNPVYMWETSDFHPAAGLNALESLSLIKIDENNNFLMHDLIRDFGRELARGEATHSQYTPKCSRLWIRDGESLHGLYNKQKEDIVAVRVDVPNADSTGEVFAGMRNIRFLSIEGEKFGKKFDHLLPDLKWLSWPHCPSSLNLAGMHIKRLTILELSQSSIDEKWKAWSKVEMIHLKVLDLKKCYKLKCTPDFSRMPNLERLTLSGCANLKKLHGSIVGLNKLQYLDLRDCSSLAELPEKLGLLENLEYLCLHGCRKLKELPHSLGKLKSLASLDISWRSDISRAIVSLLATGTTESVDADLYLGIFNNVSYHSIIGRLKEVKETIMTFQHPKLKEIPDSLMDLRALTKLDLSHSQVSSLPDSFGLLENLQELNARWSHLSALPRSIGSLKKLETLNMAFSRFLKEIPEEIGELSSLRELDLTHTAISHLPSTVTRLHLLRSLKLVDCFAFGKTVNALPATFSDYSHLEELELKCKDLDLIPPLPYGLIRLVLDGFHQELKMPDLSSMKNLTQLSVFCREDGSTCENLPCLPACLRELWLMNCLSLPDLSHLAELRKLFLIGSEFDKIPGLEKLEWLKELRISLCPTVQKLELSRLRKLKFLSVRHCLELQAVNGIEGLALVGKDVHILECGCTECYNTFKIGKPTFRKFLSSLLISKGLSPSDLPLKIRQYLDSIDAGTHSWYSFWTEIRANYYMVIGDDDSSPSSSPRMDTKDPNP